MTCLVSCEGRVWDEYCLSECWIVGTDCVSLSLVVMLRNCR